MRAPGTSSALFLVLTMLTSTEEAYTDYLERRVVTDGVDADIVRATLQQMGFDERTVAAMMGDMSVYCLPFSTSSSASSTAPTSISSVKKPSRASGPSAATSASSAPSEMAEIGQFRLVASTPAESAVHTPTAAPATADPITPDTRSDLHESKHSNADASHPCKSSPVTAAAAGAAPPSSSFSSSTSSSSAPPRTIVADTVPEAATGDSAVVFASGASSPTPSRAAATSAAGRAELPAAERAILAQWMREYRAFILSSVLQRRTPNSRTKAPSSAAPLLLPPGLPVGEGHAFPHSATGSVRAVDDDCEAARAALCDDITAQPQLAQSEGASRVPRKAEDSESFISSSDGATSSSCSAFIRTDGEHPTSSCKLLRERGTGAAAQAQGERSRGLSERINRSGDRPPYHATRAATSSTMRRAFPRSKSPAFVPTCGIFAPRGAVGCIRCNFNAAQCRHPHREAQDLRIVGASRVAANSNDKYDRRAIARSCCQARQLDAARQVQQTARARPTSDRGVPAMHPLIGTLVRPRAGLASERQMSTLPAKAKADRVRLAQYYRDQWELQERRRSTSARSAAWDVRNALLSCAGWTG
ncbi:hypothetical protein LSCM1_04369 [Leishmania martiniquensis]|uniref:Uncharacterized protein n=1 Tax=Leishmania martiniquensis TaxID=1580590 RepID=A0A836GK21_9TRYP|nr:hypothetical protein LSCM1_04369 [Leishmania martiniquensis]